MMSVAEITRAMDSLEQEAASVLHDPNLTPFERRLAFDKLLGRYQVLAEYKAAMAAFIRCMRFQRDGKAPGPDEVIREILKSPEFLILRLAVMAVFIAVVYASGPRSHWVPTALLPTIAPSFRGP